jgi:hypothetical protein
VFALGTATGYPYEVDEQWTADYRWVVDVQLECATEHIHDGIELEHLNVDGRDLRASIRRRSHIH